MPKSGHNYIYVCRAGYAHFCGSMPVHTHCAAHSSSLWLKLMELRDVTIVALSLLWFGILTTPFKINRGTSLSFRLTFLSRFLLVLSRLSLPVSSPSPLFLKKTLLSAATVVRVPWRNNLAGCRAHDDMVKVNVIGREELVAGPHDV